MRIICVGAATYSGTGAATLGDLLLRLAAAIQIDAMLQQIQLPAGIADLCAALTDLDRDDFALSNEKCPGKVG